VPDDDSRMDGRTLDRIWYSRDALYTYIRR